MARTNTYAADCAKCSKHVLAGAGTLVGPPWETLCTECVPRLKNTHVVTLTLRKEKVHVAPKGRFGNRFWDYKSVCDEAGAPYVKSANCQMCSVNAVPRLVRALKDEGFELEVDPAITEQLRSDMERKSSDTAAARERMEAFNEALKARGGALYGYQQEGVRWIAPRVSALLADDMGLGKTLQVLASIPEGVGILVIGPAVAKGVWAREASIWRPDLKVTVLSGRGNFKWPEPGELVVINYDILPTVEIGEKGNKKPAEFLKDCPESAVFVGDEIHACKNRKAQRSVKTKAIAKAIRAKGGRTWGLTATPLLNRPPELWSVLSTLGLEKETFGNFGQFCKLFNATKVQVARNRWVTEWGSPAASVPEMLKRSMLRREKKDVLHELPAKRYQEIRVNGLDKSTINACNKVMDGLNKAGVTLEDLINGVKKVPSEIGFEQMSKARAMLAKAKIPNLLSLAEEYEEAGEPLVIFSAHRAPVDIFREREGWKTITGDDPADVKTAVAEEFQEGKLKGVACTIKSGGVAITLTRAAHSIFCDKEWSPKLNEQAEDRIYRVGQSRGVLIRSLVCEHPLDEQVAQILAVKNDLIDATIDAASVKEGEVVTDAAAEVDEALTLLAAEEEAARKRVEEEMEILARQQEAIEQWESERQDRAEKEAEAQRQRKLDQRAEAAQSRYRRKRDAFFTGERRGPLTAKEKWAQNGLLVLSVSDPDRASEKNDVGFNKPDSSIGHLMVEAMVKDVGLTDAQWSLAIHMLRKYHRQIGEMPKDD